MRFTIFLICLFVSACAGNNKLDYTAPKISTIQNSEIINSDFETTWNNLIANLSKKYFVINNVEKESRIINVSFSSNEPSNFIDCGKTERTFTQATGYNPEHFRYDSAVGKTIYKMVVPDSQLAGFTVPYQIVRTTNVSGRTNIYVAPNGNQTEISVNTLYKFDRSQYGESIAQSRPPINGHSQTLTFSTEKPGTVFEEGVEYKCISKGVIERDILNAAKAK